MKLLDKIKKVGRAIKASVSAFINRDKTAPVVEPTTIKANSQPIAAITPISGQTIETIPDITPAGRRYLQEYTKAGGNLQKGTLSSKLFDIEAGRKSVGQEFTNMAVDKSRIIYSIEEYMKKIGCSSDAIEKVKESLNDLTAIETEVLYNEYLDLNAYFEYDGSTLSKTIDILQAIDDFKKRS